MQKTMDINWKRLWELAKEGKSADEIMKELDLKEMATLENAVEQLMREKGVRIRVPGITGKGSLNPRYTENGIRISPEMLEGTGFKEGDQFHFKMEGGKIVLEKST